jgi:hypothetical protein
VVKPVQLQSSGISCGKIHCIGLVSVSTLTRNRTSGLDPLVTLSSGHPSANLQTRLIMASKCISKLSRIRPPQVHLQTSSITISESSLSSLDHALQVYLQIRSITTSKCISKLARSRPRSVSLSSLNRYFQEHLELLSSTTCSQSRYTVCRWVAI